MNIVIGSRESKLAVRQSGMVIDFLKEAHPESEVRLATFKTTGDKVLDRRLDEIGGKGLFVKELDAALRAGECDYTVHSCKDLPADIPDDLPLVCFSAREDPRDVLVFPKGADGPDFSLPIGTSSRRREVQLREVFPQARFESVRGNLQTRLRKLDEGGYGALVLAAAGLKRMGLSHRIGRYLQVEEVIPSAGQGVLAVQGRMDAHRELFEGFADGQAASAVAAERAFVKRLGGSCTSPIAAYARVDGGSVEFWGMYYDEDRREMRRDRITGPAREGVQLAEELADRLRMSRK